MTLLSSNATKLPICSIEGSHFCLTNQSITYYGLYTFICRAIL